MIGRAGVRTTFWCRDSSHSARQTALYQAISRGQLRLADALCDAGAALEKLSLARPMMPSSRNPGELPSHVNRRLCVRGGANCCCAHRRRCLPSARWRNGAARSSSSRFSQCNRVVDSKRSQYKRKLTMIGHFFGCFCFCFCFWFADSTI